MELSESINFKALYLLAFLGSEFYLLVFDIRRVLNLALPRSTVSTYGNLLHDTEGFDAFRLKLN